MYFKTSFRPFVAIPVAPIITGIIIHYMFHVRCISMHKLLYFSFLAWACVCTTCLSFQCVRLCILSNANYYYYYYYYY
jgi:hypothetical protein